MVRSSPYEPNNNRIFQRVKNVNEASTLKVILNLSNFQPEKILVYIGTYCTNKLLWSYVGDPFIPKSTIFWSLSFFANLVCSYVRKITHYSVQPNNSANIRLKNPDIRIKRIIRLKSWIRFLLKRIRKSNIRIRLIRNRIPFWTIRIRL